MSEWPMEVSKISTSYLKRVTMTEKIKMNMLSPGVYTSEEDASISVSLQAGTTACFAGEFETGYGNWPTLVTSLNQFKLLFGNPSNGNYNDWAQVSTYFGVGAKSIFISRAVDANGQYAFLDKYQSENVSNGTVTDTLKIKYPVTKIFKGSFIKLFGDTDEVVYKVHKATETTTPLAESREFEFTGDIDASETYTLTITDTETNTSTDIVYSVPDSGSVTKADVINGLYALFVEKKLDYVNMTTDADNNKFVLTASKTGVINGFTATISSSTSDDDFTATELVQATDGAATIVLDQDIIWSGFNGSDIAIDDGIYYLKTVAMNASTDIEKMGGTPRTDLQLFGIREQILNPKDWDAKEDFLQLVDGDSKVRFIYRYPGVIGNQVKVGLVKGSSLGEGTPKDTVNVVTNGDGSSVKTTVKTTAWMAADNYPIDNIIDYPIKDDDYIVVISNKDKVLETFVVSFDKNAKDNNGKSMYIENVINKNSNYVYVKDNEANQTLPAGKIFRTITTIVENFDKKGVKTAKSVTSTEGGSLAEFFGGDDGEVGAGDIIEAYKDYEDKEIYLIDNIIANEKTHRYCVDLADKREDCVCFVGARYGDIVGKRASVAIKKMTDYINDPLSDMNVATSYACFYANYANIYMSELDKNVWVNLAGAVCGLRNANTDDNFVFTANAGLRRGQLNGIGLKRLAFIPNLGQRDYLYKKSCNIITAFPGEGNVVWGIKTLYRLNSAFSSENIRNLFNYLKRNIAKFSKAYVFELNNEHTRLLFTDALTSFLDLIKAEGGLYDYAVKINTDPELIDAGILEVNIALKPTRTITFIHLSFISTKTGTDFTEVLGK